MNNRDKKIDWLLAKVDAEISNLNQLNDKFHIFPDKQPTLEELGKLRKDITDLKKSSFTFLKRGKNKAIDINDLNIRLKNIHEKIQSSLEMSQSKEDKKPDLPKQSDLTTTSAEQQHTWDVERAKTQLFHASLEKDDLETKLENAKIAKQNARMRYVNQSKGEYRNHLKSLYDEERKSYSMVNNKYTAAVNIYNDALKALEKLENKFSLEKMSDAEFTAMLADLDKPQVKVKSGTVPPPPKAISNDDLDSIIQDLGLFHEHASTQTAHQDQSISLSNSESIIATLEKKRTEFRNSMTVNDKRKLGIAITAARLAEKSKDPIQFKEAVSSFNITLKKYESQVTEKSDSKEPESRRYTKE